MSGIAIRAVEPGDAPAIVSLLNEIIAAGAYSIMTTPMTVDDQRAYIDACSTRGVYLAAIESGSLLGIQGVEPVSAEPALAHVGDVSTFVRRRARGRGVGRGLNAATEPAARGAGFRKLLAIVRADNPDALAFYGALGYERVGVFRAHARIGERFVDEVQFEKHLDRE